MTNTVSSISRKSTNQSGQGIIEYILVLVVTVGLIVGLLTQFNKSIELWLNNYFGDYLACLLETGELPALGTTEAGGICSRYHSPFVADLDAGESESGGNDSEDSKNSSGSSTPKKAKKSVSKASKSQAGVNSNASSTSSGKFGRVSSFRASSNRGGRGGIRAGQSDEVSTGSTKVSTPAGLSGAGPGPNVIRMKTNDMNLGFSIQKDKEKEREKKISVPASTEEQRKINRDERFLASKISKVKAKDLDADLGIGLGDYFRYLLIAGIIIAIAVFFGGQALQMSKEMD